MDYNQDTRAISNIESLIAPLSTVLSIQSDVGLQIPKGPTTSRPAGAAGILRYNEDTGRIEGFISNVWTDIVSNTSIQGDFTNIASNINISELGGTANVEQGGTGLTSLGSPLQVLRVNSAGTALEYATASTGTVTSIDVNGGTTGLTFTGGPVTTNGNISLSGVLLIANGGTGATTTEQALTNLGAYPASNPAGYTSNLGTVTSVGITQPTAGITVSGSPITTNGNIVLALSNDLLAVESLTTAGIAVRTGTDTWTTRSIAAGPGIQVTNGSGIAGDITISNTELSPGSGVSGKVYSIDIGNLSGTTQFPADTPPTTTSGWLVTTSPTITANSTSSKFIVDFSCFVDVSSNNRNISMAIFRGSTLIAYSVVTVTTSGRPQTLRCFAVDSPATVTPFTYTIRLGMDNAGTSYINQSVNANITNIGKSSFIITELY